MTFSAWYDVIQILEVVEEKEVQCSVLEYSKYVDVTSMLSPLKEHACVQSSYLQKCVRASIKKREVKINRYQIEWSHSSTSIDIQDGAWL